MAVEELVDLPAGVIVSLLDFNELFDAAADALEHLRPPHKSGDEGCGCEACDAWGRLNRAWQVMA